MLFWISAGSAKKQAVLREMQIKNQNLFILPGGVAEIFLSQKRHQPNDMPFVQTIKARRYGLMKLALQTGAIIYPSFCFGISDVLDQLASIDGGGTKEQTQKQQTEESATSKENGNDEKKKNGTTILDRMANVMEYISRKIGGGLTLYYGQYYLPIPYNPQVSLVLGDPIYPVPVKKNDDGSTNAMKNLHGDKVTCERIDNPTEEQVNELMDRYVDALQCLFEQYKVEDGYPSDTLRII